MHLRMTITTQQNTLLRFCCNLFPGFWGCSNRTKPKFFCCRIDMMKGQRLCRFLITTHSAFTTQCSNQLILGSFSPSFYIFRSSRHYKSFMVGTLGLEPSLTLSESVVQPVTPYPCNLWKGRVVLPHRLEIQSLRSFY